VEESKEKVEASLIISSSPEELFEAFISLSSYPAFVPKLKSVTPVGEKKVKWVMDASLNGGGETLMDWTIAITSEHPPRMFTWKTCDASPVKAKGCISLKPLSGDRGTQVKVVFQYTRPNEFVINSFIRFFGEPLHARVKEVLRRFKCLIETGEIATTEGQSHGAISKLETFSDWLTRIESAVLMRLQSPKKDERKQRIMS